MAVGHTLHHRILGIEFFFITTDGRVFGSLLNNFIHLSMVITNFCVILPALAVLNYTRFLLDVLIIPRAALQRRSLTPRPATILRAR